MQVNLTVAQMSQLRNILKMYVYMLEDVHVLYYMDSVDGSIEFYELHRRELYELIKLLEVPQ